MPRAALEALYHGTITSPPNIVVAVAIPNMTALFLGHQRPNRGIAEERQ